MYEKTFEHPPRENASAFDEAEAIPLSVSSIMTRCLPPSPPRVRQSRWLFSSFGAPAEGQSGSHSTKTDERRQTQTQKVETKKNNLVFTQGSSSVLLIKEELILFGLSKSYPEPFRSAKQATFPPPPSIPPLLPGFSRSWRQQTETGIRAHSQGITKYFGDDIFLPSESSDN